MCMHYSVQYKHGSLEQTSVRTTGPRLSPSVSGIKHKTKLNEASMQPVMSAHVVKCMLAAVVAHVHDTCWLAFWLWRGWSFVVECMVSVDSHGCIRYSNFCVTVQPLHSWVYISMMSNLYCRTLVHNTDVHSPFHYLSAVHHRTSAPPAASRAVLLSKDKEVTATPSPSYLCTWWCFLSLDACVGLKFLSPTPP